MSTGEHNLAGFGRRDAAEDFEVPPQPDPGVYKNPRLEWILALGTGLAAVTMVRFGIGVLGIGYLVIVTAFIAAFQRGFPNRLTTAGFVISVALCASFWGALVVGWID
jgi:hypothetical protein